MAKSGARKAQSFGLCAEVFLAYGLECPWSRRQDQSMASSGSQQHPPRLRREGGGGGGGQSSAARACRCIGLFLGHLFSNLGLFAIVVGYVLLGALMFEFLEAEYELQQRGNIKRYRDDCLKELWLITGKYNPNF
jgi:hypothetical protein